MNFIIMKESEKEILEKSRNIKAVVNLVETTMLMRENWRIETKINDLLDEIAQMKKLDGFKLKSYLNKIYVLVRDINWNFKRFLNLKGLDPDKCFKLNDILEKREKGEPLE